MSKVKQTSHHFRGLAFYANELRAYAEGKPAFTGKGRKPRNKELLAAIESIDRCTKNRKQGSFSIPPRLPYNSAPVGGTRSQAPHLVPPTHLPPNNKLLPLPKDHWSPLMKNGIRPLAKILHLMMRDPGVSS